VPGKVSRLERAAIPVNALLSSAYSLLAKDLTVASNATGVYHT
jgi:hypothetical protein